MTQPSPTSGGASSDRTGRFVTQPNGHVTPLSPHIGIWRWHVTMAASILFRATIIAATVGALIVVAWLGALAFGPDAYAAALALAGSPLGLFVGFGLTVVLFSFILTNEQIPQGIAEWLTQSGIGMIGFLIAVNVLLLVMGSFMEPSSIILITAPILFPIAMKLGIDPIHFGVMITVNMEIGMITPPVGLNLYVASGIAKMGLTDCSKAVWPWLMTMLVYLMVITYVPAVSTWLPKTLGMM